MLCGLFYAKPTYPRCLLCLPCRRKLAAISFCFFSSSLANQIGGSVDFVDVYVGRGEEGTDRVDFVYMYFSVISG